MKTRVGRTKVAVRRLAEQVLRAVSPRHRRWYRLLASLTLDPDLLPRPVEPPGNRDVIICGPPRTGTTLLTAALYQPPRMITVMEPWDAMRLPPAQLFGSLRQEVERSGRLARGRLDIGALLEDGEARWGRDGQHDFPVEVDDDYLLGVKFPVFWRYLELLPATRFLVCVRDPVAVVTSCRRTSGRLMQGLDYDVPFNREMNAELRSATDEPAVRRVLLYDHIMGRVLPHLDRSTVLLVRYERWFSDPEALMADIGDFLGIRLGAPAATIRPPRSPALLDPRDLDAVRQHCTTAARLGYDVEQVP